ncbi:TlpA disulfide reductase family protein [Flavobacteriaceae bacterium S356]|uniref:TlpA disulfide reductase family protein n=1 Tax=Asprobacillus argus TaxID=3076534 RepID=A0ABU3LE61_9FLAO|nr:TlpA disulfide reductase family protein [Flavobacteriaceae bacterium S356]
MRNFLILFLFVTTAALQAQYTISGTIQPVNNYKNALLYKVEGARQVYIRNAKIEKGIDQSMGSFEFIFNNDIAPGSYRITYDLQQGGFIDFLYNKEDVSFNINPNSDQPVVTFEKSKENLLYSNFLSALSVAQYKTDSLQIAYLRAPSKVTGDTYKEAVKNIKAIQADYTQKANNMLVLNFIKATDRYNAVEPAKTPKEYFTGVLTHFFDNINFKNPFLFNSSFLIDRITDYVFYMNYTDDRDQQLTLHKNAVDKVMGLINDPKFKADVIEFLATQFSSAKETKIVDYIISNHFEKLPAEFKNQEFKNKILGDLAIATGRTAPDFSWEENGKTVTLSELNDGKHYVLIFYSTECPHCLREIPQFFEFMKGKDQVKVIAFAMENTNISWNKFKSTLPGWHHALGLGKWENKIARTYQIVSTPTYFVLDADKKIIGNPEELDDLKAAVSQLKM